MSRHPHSPRKDGVDPVTRARARRRALQAVYAWQMSGGEVGQVIAQFAHEQAHETADLEYFEDLVRGVVRHRASLDEALLLAAEAGESGEVLRCWEWPHPAVILGSACSLSRDVDEAACRADGRARQ